MSLTYPEAIDEMFLMLKTAWANSSPSILPYVPNISYPGIETPSVPVSGKYHAKADIYPVSEKQRTLSTNVDIGGGRRYNNRGILKLQIMCPLSDVRNAEIGIKLGILARDAFRGKHSPCGIVFYNAVVIPSMPSEVFSKYI